MTNVTWPEWGAQPPHAKTHEAFAHYGPLITTKTHQPNYVDYAVIQCKSCVLNHVVPLPTETDLEQYYREDFWSTPLHARGLENYEADRAWWTQCVYAPLFDQAAALCASGPYLCLVDVGAGWGIGCDVADARNWFSLALEPDHELCARLEERGILAFSRPLAQFYSLLQFVRVKRRAFPLLPVDIILAYEVLEHQHNPEDFLCMCWEMLRPGGVLIVVVPNDFNPLQLQAQALYDLPPWWVQAPQHLTYFTPKTLQLLLRRCGFTIADMRGTYALEQALLAGECYVGNAELGRRVHGRRMLLELEAVKNNTWTALETAYRDALHTGRLGREIVCLAQKL